MSMYSVSRRTTATGSAAPCLEIRSAATDRPRIKEIGVTINAATASVFGLGRPQAIGITPTSPVTVLAEEVADPVGTAQLALAWATPPTVPVNFFRRVSLEARIGAGVIWTFPRGLVIPISSSIVLWNITTVSAADVWVVVDE